MHGLSPRDGDREIDWGKTSDDYATHRPGYPDSFFQRLEALDVIRPGLRVLDLGTGTGNLARALAARGCRVVGVDVSPEQVEAAKRLARDQGVPLEAHVATAERTGVPDASFDLVTASQCWLYFDAATAQEEVRRVLAPGGRLMTCHLSWLPRLDPVARRSEELVLAHSPDWTAADWSGDIPALPQWVEPDFRLVAMFQYDEPLTFTHAGWRGRIRACRGVGATLSAEEVARFDEEHATLLRDLVPDPFTVLHRIDAHVLQPHD